jgi:hypothetical protein
MASCRRLKHFSARAYFSNSAQQSFWPNLTERNSWRYFPLRSLRFASRARGGHAVRRPTFGGHAVVFFFFCPFSYSFVFLLLNINMGLALRAPSSRLAVSSRSDQSVCRAAAAGDARCGPGLRVGHHARRPPLRRRRGGDSRPERAAEGES